MRRREIKNQSSYRYFLFRTLSVFLIVYLLVMGIYTCVLAQYYQVEIEKILAQTTNRVKDCIVYNGEIKIPDGGNLSKEKTEMWREGRINRIAAYYYLFINQGEHPDDDAQLAVYNENDKKWIAKTGDSLIFKEDSSLEVDQDLLNKFEKEDFEIYGILYMERYLTQEQIHSILKDMRYGNGTFRVEGYYSEGEIIPQKLQQYELTTEKSDSSKLISKELINTYIFDNPIDTTKMIPFTGESDHYFSRNKNTSFYYNNQEGDWNWEAYNKALIPNMEDIIQEEEPKLDNKKNLFKVSVRQLERVDVGESTYWISSYLVCFPLYETIIISGKVYLIGIIIAIIFTGICSVVLWKRYRSYAYKY